jgi:tRNA dimethylallyltransferase
MTTGIVAPIRAPIIVIVGPTASGKTALAIDIARTVGGEVISADSRQVYRGLDIGTGKVTKREMRGVPHHLLDVASPRSVYTAHRFVRDATKAIRDIHRRGKIPVVAGGTGFYIDALLGRVGIADVPRNTALRGRLSKKTVAQLFTLLQKQDPARASQMDTPSERNNKVRLIRALEIASTPRRRLGVDADVQRHSTDTRTIWIGIAPDSVTLQKKIRTRLIARLHAGMVAEARRLHAEGLSWKRMESLGLEYRYLARLLQGKISRDEFDTQLFHEICAYAKRQETYWKRNKEIRWLRTVNRAAVLSYIQDTIERAHIRSWETHGFPIPSSAGTSRFPTPPRS